MNWVEKKAHARQLIEDHSGALWRDLVSAMRAAIDSYHTHFHGTGLAVEMNVPDVPILDRTRVRIDERQTGRELYRIEIAPDSKLPGLEVEFFGLPVEKIRLRMEPGEGEQLRFVDVSTGSPLDAETAAERILSPALFPIQAPDNE